MLSVADFPSTKYDNLIRFEFQSQEGVVTTKRRLLLCCLFVYTIQNFPKIANPKNPTFLHRSVFEAIYAHRVAKRTPIGLNINLFMFFKYDLITYFDTPLSLPYAYLICNIAIIKGNVDIL